MVSEWSSPGFTASGVEPELTFEEMFGDPENYRQVYYARSGRYHGCFKSQKAADEADDYRYCRDYLPGGVLPWEVKQDESYS